MPYITVKMIEGRTDDQKRALCEKVTQAVVETTGTTADSVTVFIEEMPKNHLFKNGKLMSEQ